MQDVDPRLRAALSDRDRVLDAAKGLALLLVVVGHSLAWDVSTGEPGNVLDRRPAVVALTWVVQVLPLFFAAGAVANAGSWARDPRPTAFLRRRLLRLVTPGLVYTAVWTALLLALRATGAVDGALVEDVGRFLAQLLWFLGVYAAVVVAVPWTTRWARRPGVALPLWFAVLVLVDVLRLTVAEGVGWVNLVAVWGFLHQLGYHLPALARVRRSLVVLGAVGALAAALLLALVGPYSTSLVTYASDPAPSNLAPPTVVLALHGVALILLLAALRPRLERALTPDRRYLLVAALGARGVGLYLWHIPLVAVVTGIAWGIGLPAEPFDPLWWGAHVLGLLVILPVAWLLAGAAGRADAVLVDHVAERVPPSTAARWLLVVTAVLVPALLLNVSTTGFATWWGPGMLDLPSSSLLNLALLVLAWVAISASRAPAPRA